MRKAIIYIRVRGEGPSVEWQRAVCRRAADRIGVSIAKEYIDQGWGQERPARKRMLAELDAGHRGDLLLAFSGDRLTRNSQKWVRLLRLLEAAGVLLVLADQMGEDVSVPLLLFTQQLHLLVASYTAQSSRNSDRTHTGGEA